MISDEQAAGLVQAAVQVQPDRLIRQTLTESGNEIFRALLPGGQSVVLRVSPQPAAFAGTPRNLVTLHGLGLPVPKFLGGGATASGGCFMVLSWIPGRDLVFELAAMSPDQMTRVALAVTECQKRAATLPQGAGFGWAPIGGTPPAATWAELFGAPDPAPVAPGASPLETLRGRLRAVRREVEPHFAAVRPVCFLDELTTKNVLVESGAFQGIIDLDSVCYGDPLLAIGSTIALVAAEVGAAGTFYGEELIRCWNPARDERRAIRFYAALWAVGLLSAADSPARAQTLTGLADAMLGLAETV